MGEAATTGVTIDACSFCGHACFPARLLCHRCGGADWNSFAVRDGLIEERTMVHHQADAAAPETVFLASVRTAAGVLLLARLPREFERGTPVSLAVAAGGAILAHPREPG
jgi:uncharacterized OB-fold protein